jgi:hypothetical protein
MLIAILTGDVPAVVCRQGAHSFSPLLGRDAPIADLPDDNRRRCGHGGDNAF